MTDAEIERMTLCVAQMAATLAAGDAMAAREKFDDRYYAHLARSLYDTVEDVVAHGSIGTPDDVQALLEDVERLDWLEENGVTVMLSGHRDVIGTSRAAIDAAREGTTRTQSTPKAEER